MICLKEIIPLVACSLLIFQPSYSSQHSYSDILIQDSLPKKSIHKQPVYTTSRLITDKPVIDGTLNDECWKYGTWAGNYTQFVPVEGGEPTYPTEFNIQYDDRNIYIAFRAFDGEPDKILRLAGGHDEFAGDIVGISLDSYHDHRTGFEFSITAWGQKIDLILSNPLNWDINWNAVWAGKTGIEDSAWVAEIEVPLSQIRYSKEDKQVWGIHTWRWISRLQEESNFEVQSKTGPGILYNFAELRGIEGLKKSQRLEIMPYMLGNLSTMEEEAGNPFTENGRRWGGNLGLDAKIGISSNFTIDMTINPDFGQVESDPSVMNLTAFETFYDEKRPFFIEGSTIFDYDFDDQKLFYSRRIGQSPSYNVNPGDSIFVKSPERTTILSAVKLSGKTAKGLSVGLMQSLTANEKAKLSHVDGAMNEQEVEPFTNYMVARIQQDYREGTTSFGGMMTATNRFINNENLASLSNNAYTGGLDLLHQWNDKEYFVDARLIGSFVEGDRKAITALQESSARYFQRPGADYLNYDTSRTNLSGLGGKIRIGKGSKGFWRYSTGVNWFSPGLELNDIGYMQLADNIALENVVSYFVNQPGSVFRTYTIELEQFNSWNFSGAYLGSGGHLSFNSEFKNKWKFGTNLIFHSKTLDTRILRGGYAMVVPYILRNFSNISTDPSKIFILGFQYNYQYSGNNSASVFQMLPNVTIRPVRNLRVRMTASYNKNNNSLQYIARRSFNTDNSYILGTIDQKTLGLTFRIDLNITPEFSVQYYGSPFVSKGSYSGLKYITYPESENYGDRFQLYNDPYLSNGKYYLDENNDMVADYSINNPDFDFHQLRSNFVAKWEYCPGSFIYLVCAGERTGRSQFAGNSFGESFRQLWKEFPNRVFLIKFNYWFSL